MPYKDFKSTEIIDEIGLELRKLRNEKKLSLATVSDAMEQQQIHISGTMLGRMENGERRIDDSLLHALCRLYDADPNALIIRACQTHSALCPRRSGQYRPSLKIAERLQKDAY